MAQSEIELPGWRLRFWPRREARPIEEPATALAPYHPLTRRRFKRALGLSVLMLFCLVYGFFFAALAPSLMVVLLAPLAVVGMLVIWALPDLHWAPTRQLEWLFFATFIGLIVWPNYLAISLPGLPWITVLRLTSFPLVLVLLISISVSDDFRSTLNRSLRSIPAIPILLGIFVAIQLISIGFSAEISGSIQKFVVAQTTCTAVFFVGAYVFLSPGRIKRWAMVLWAMAIFVSLIAIWEYRIGHLPWVGHIPSFLKVDDEAVQSILGAHMRAGSTRYRAEATFSTPLGLGEYLALTLPFVLHFTTTRFSRRMRVAAFVSIPLIFYSCYLTDAKLGMIGCLFGSILYLFGMAFQNRRRNKGSLIAASFLFGFPGFLALLATMMMASHRFSVLIFGNDGSHANSTAARVTQYSMGLQKFLEWPFGYGIGMGGATLGFGKDINGMITIDTYYLSVLLEYGIAGFIVYYGMFAIAIYESGKRALLTSLENEDRSFLLPITVSLVVFILIKSVFSQTDNHPVVFMMLGALMALAVSYTGASTLRARNAVKNRITASPKASKPSS